MFMCSLTSNEMYRGLLRDFDNVLVCPVSISVSLLWAVRNSSSTSSLCTDLYDTYTRTSK